MDDWYDDDAEVADYAKNVSISFPNLAKAFVDVLKKSYGIENDNDPCFDLMLDAGCGSGNSTRIFAPYFKSIIGFDPSDLQVAFAKKITNQENIKYVVGPGELMPAEDETVDMIVSCFAVQHMNIEKFVSECNRVLKPKGHVFAYGHEYADLQIVGANPVSGKKVLDRFLTRAAAFRKKNLNETSIYDRYGSIFDKITGIKKFRIDDLVHGEEMCLGGIKRRFYSIPDYRMFIEQEAKDSSDPMKDFLRDIKDLWGVPDKDENDIKVKLILSFFVVCLEK